jgi:YD repeat-containing protein
MPNQRSNAGFGWLISLGRLIPPGDPTNQTTDQLGDLPRSFVYETPDGADHTFTGDASVVGQPVFSLDDANLRLTKQSDGSLLLELPDGTRQTFQDRPAPMNGSNVDWRLVSMTDRFGNDVRITYSADGNTWNVVDHPELRAQVLTFHTASAIPDGVTTDQTRSTSPPSTAGARITASRTR